MTAADGFQGGFLDGAEDGPRAVRRRPVRHVIKVLVALLRQALVRDAQFRSQVWTTFVVGLLEVAVALVPALLVFGRTRIVNGWQVGEVIAVTGAAQLLTALLAAFVTPNQSQMSDYIREGKLDQLLIRPVPTQLYVAVRWIRPAELWGVLTGVLLIIVGCRRAGLTPGVPEMLVAAGWFVAGLVAVTLLWTNIGYLAFWLTSAGQVAELLDTLLTAARYPLAFYPAAVRTVLIAVVPLGLASTVPIQALRGDLRPELLPVAVPLLLILIIGTRLHWLAGISRYSGASS